MRTDSIYSLTGVLYLKLRDGVFFIMNQALDFLRQTKVELAKVVWPSREQTVKLTLIVVIVTIIVGFFLFGLDYVFLNLITFLTK